MADIPRTGPRSIRRVATNYSLIQELKLARGAVAQVIAYGEDGEVIHKITVPDIHNKHVRVMTALESIPWEAVDLLDKKGNLVKRHTRNADDRLPAGDIEDLGGPQSTKLAELAAALNLMLKAQDVALVRHGQAQEALLGAHTKLLEGALKRLEAEETRNARERSMNFKLGAELLAAQMSQMPEVQPLLTDGEGEQTMTGSMLEQMLPQLLQMAFARQRPQPKNDEEPKDEPKKKAAKAPAAKTTNGHNKPTSEDRSPSAAPSTAAGTS